MATVAEKRAAFRKLHAGGCFVIPNPWDIGSARYLQHLGFKALASTSAGYAFTPQLLLFGKLGYVHDRQHNVFTSSGGTFFVNGQIVPGPPSSESRFGQSGFETGGGVEYSLANHFYADAQYIYSKYRNHTVRNRVMLGVGYRF